MVKSRLKYHQLFAYVIIIELIVPCPKIFLMALEFRIWISTNPLRSLIKSESESNLN